MIANAVNEEDPERDRARRRRRRRERERERERNGTQNIHYGARDIHPLGD